MIATSDPLDTIEQSAAEFTGGAHWEQAAKHKIE